MATKIPIKKSGDKFKLADANALATSVNALIDESLPKTGVKTINGVSIVGTGDITITGSGGSLALGETAGTAYRGDRGKQAFDHISNKANPHEVTKAQVGLGNVDNTTDVNKPVSTATQLALNQKEPIITTKGTAFNKNFGTTAGTVADGGALAAKQDALSSGVNIKTVNGNSILGVGNLVITGGGSSVQHELWLEDLRVEGDTDTTLLKKGIVQMQSLKTPLRLDAREYNITDWTIISGEYLHIKGTKGSFSSGTRLKGAIPNFGRITSAVDPILSYPTTTDPAPMKGCCFYMTSLIYDAIIEDVTFVDFRIACAYLESHNSPLFRNVNYFYCNVGTICYQGSQNYQYINCSSQVVNTIHISSATCFPAGSPYASQDNYYTDTLVMKNEDGYGSFNSFDINVNFDNFYRESILRPTVDSVAIAKTTKYLDASGNIYANNSDYCNPSGWAVFCPVRNERLLFNWNFKSLDFRGRLQRGFCLANYAVIEFLTDGNYSFELEGALKPLFTLGSNFHLLNLSPSRPTGAIGAMFFFTDRGSGGGFAESTNKYLIDINTVVRPAITEPYSRLLFFDVSKNLPEYALTSSQEIEVVDPTSASHVVGNVITMNIISSNGARLTFKTGQFNILTSGVIDYSKPIQLEFKYDTPKVLVKIYNKLTSEQWQTINN